MSGFYRDAEGNVIGPISSNEAKRLVDLHVIHRDTPIAQRPEGPWVVASRVKGLFDTPHGAPNPRAAEPAHIHAIPQAAGHADGGISTGLARVAHAVRTSLPAISNTARTPGTSLFNPALVVGGIAGLVGVLLGGAILFALVGSRTATQPSYVASAAAGSGGSAASQSQGSMLQATRIAWDALMDADAALAAQQFSLPSEKFKATAYIYSKIPLQGVDPILQKHVIRTIEANKAATQVCLSFESEMQVISQRVSQAAQFGQVLGGAASSPDEAASNAAGLGLLFGTFAEAGAMPEAQAAYDRMQKKMQPIVSELQAVTEADATVAKALTQKYGVPFVDAF